MWGLKVSKETTERKRKNVGMKTHIGNTIICNCMHNSTNYLITVWLWNLGDNIVFLKRYVSVLNAYVWSIQTYGYVTVYIWKTFLKVFWYIGGGDWKCDVNGPSGEQWFSCCCAYGTYKYRTSTLTMRELAPSVRNRLPLSVIAGWWCYYGRKRPNNVLQVCRVR